MQTFGLTLYEKAAVIRLFQTRSCNSYANCLGSTVAEYFAIRICCRNYRSHSHNPRNPLVGSSHTTPPVTLTLISEINTCRLDTAVNSPTFLGAKIAQVKNERERGKYYFQHHKTAVNTFENNFTGTLIGRQREHRIAIDDYNIGTRLQA